MNGHVFISYARDGGEGQTWAEHFERHLSKWDIPVFRDESSLAPGDDWVEGIPRGLSAARAVLLVVSRSARKSRWVRRELGYADKRNIRVIPAIVEQGAELPFAVQTTVPLDFVNEPDRAWADLEMTLNRLFTSTPREGECNRARELAYLERLRQDRLVSSTGRFYAPLAGQEAKTRRLDVIDEALMPQSFRHERVRELEERPPEPLKTRHYEDVREVLEVSATSTDPGRLVLLGEPGSGKTYTLGRIILELARRCEQDASAALPVFVPLGQWIHPDEDAIAGLRAYVAQQLGELADCYEPLRAEKRLALLLDGLNEIPGEQRKEKSAAIWALTRDDAFPLLVVSCRIRDFEARNTRLELDTLTIEPLTAARVRTFIRRYLTAQGRADGGAKAEELFWYLAGGNRLKRLQQSWLAMGLSDCDFWSSPDLPEISLSGLDRWLPWRRRRWQRNRDYWRWNNDDRRTQLEDPRSLLKLAQRPFFLLMMVLLYIRHGTDAFKGNRSQLFGRFVTDAIERVDEPYRNKHEGDSHPGRNGIEPALGRLAWAMQNRAQGPDKVQLALKSATAETLLSEAQQDLAQGAGLLEWRTSVRFTHQLLQEYFAALGMRSEILADTLSAAELWPKERWWARTGWEEAAVFLAGLKPQVPGLIVDWLKDAQPAVLVQSLKESGCAAPASELLLDLKVRWLPRLYPSREPAPEGRHAVALAVGALDLDDRPGVGLRADGLPGIDGVEIPAGTFLYGEDKAESRLDTFWMARHPITNAQYQAFIDDGGYREDRWWQGLAERIEAPREPKWQEPNRPRETVSWYEAMAFCAWLTDRLGVTIRLPTEQQWEKAARGTDGREYPWGDDYLSGYANINETWGEAGEHNLGQTTAVGLYPQGRSPYGVMDLAGNVWEWCLNKYDDPSDTSESGKGRRVLRGGSWGSNRYYARASYRYYYYFPGFRYFIGFRVCSLSPIV